MAQLLFFDEGHTYQLDGQPLPSVSEVIRFISREIYGEVSQFKLDQAADRGSRVHKLLEALDKYGTIECPESLAGYLKAYLSFRNDHTVAWQQIERITYHPELGYAGTIDRLGLVDGKRMILDFKTSYTVHKPLVTAQQNLYKLAWEAQTGEQIDAIAALHLKADGTYKLHALPIDPATGLACLTLHNALKKKVRKKNNG